MKRNLDPAHTKLLSERLVGMSKRSVTDESKRRDFMLDDNEWEEVRRAAVLLRRKRLRR